MFFHIKRYYYGILKNRSWLWLVVIPPLFYLIASSINPNHFIIHQDVNISSDAPVALLSSPVGYIPMQEFISHPGKLFQNKFVLRGLYDQIYSDIDYYRTDPQFRELFLIAKNQLSLVKTKNDIIQIAYGGPDKSLGIMMVGYYMDRLVQNAAEGIKRSRSNKYTKPQVDGETKIVEKRILFNNKRLLQLGKVAFISLICVLIFFGLLESRDSSFKSERQMARYLEVPILGSVPDLNKVYASMGK